MDQLKRMVAFFLLAEKKDQCCRYLFTFRKTLEINFYRHHAMVILTFLPTFCIVHITNINGESFCLIPTNISSKKYIKWRRSSNLPLRGGYNIFQPKDFMKLITIAGRSSVQNISSSSCELLLVGCSHSEFPTLSHPIFGTCHSQFPALS